MIIAPHCQPESYRNDNHTPVCAWPEDCYVQWGATGIVFTQQEKGSYKTAFFEAFPTDPKTFLRGEGASIEEAERKAFAQFEKHQACANHEFERKGYTNGAGFCKHCGLFASRMFEPIEDPNPKPKSRLETLLLGLVEDEDPESTVEQLTNEEKEDVKFMIKEILDNLVAKNSNAQTTTQPAGETA